MTPLNKGIAFSSKFTPFCQVAPGRVSGRAQCTFVSSVKKIEQQNLSLFFSVCIWNPAINSNVNVRHLFSPLQGMKPRLFSRVETPWVCKAEDSSSAKTSSLALILLLMLGASFFAGRKDVRAEGVSDEELIAQLLKTKRNILQKIDLFQLLLKKGEEEASKAEGKDIVMIFGDTGAGKSTLVNFLYGCSMKIDDSDHVIVDPGSLIPKVAKIGEESASCTFLPQRIPDFSVKNRVFTIYDMPGMSDNRGIEVVLANVIVEKKLVQIARSTRLVMMVEEGSITARKAESWKETIKLLEDRFGSVVGRGSRNLCIIVTKHKYDLNRIKKKIKNCKLDNGLDLSSYVTIYNPLNTNDRGNLLDIIFNTQKHAGCLDSHIALSKSELHDATNLGGEVKKNVLDHLQQYFEAQKKDKIDEAVKKVKFTHAVASLENEELREIHEVVERALLGYAKKYLDEIEPNKNFVLENQAESFKKYKEIRDKFNLYANFDAYDREVRDMAKRSEGRREVIAWNEADASFYLTIATIGSIGLTAISLSVPPLAVGMACLSAASLTATGKAYKHYVWPTSKEQKESDFYNGPSLKL